MLRQLADLTLEADARYAEDYELQFLEEYCDSLEVRISAYTKIRTLADEIIEQVKIVKQERHDDFEDYYSTCKRDLTRLLLYSASAILFDDLDRMRENALLWFQTIARAFNYEDDNVDTYGILLEVMKQFLSKEELEYALPVFELNCTVLV